MNPPRLDLYSAIHKAMRLAMADSLCRLGSLDLEDAGQRQALFAQLQGLLDMCRSHVEKEEKFMHPAIEARRPGQSQRIADEHAEHLASLDSLEAACVALQCAPETGAAHRLYLQLSRFVAENFEHMEFEETVHNALLWSAYSDAELLKLHQAIVGSIAPAEMGKVLDWMLPALHHGERCALLGGLRASAPPPAFEAALQLAQRRLPAAEWAKLDAALAVAA